VGFWSYKCPICGAKFSRLLSNFVAEKKYRLHLEEHRTVDLHRQK
jgi:hypothetical protein